MNTFMQQITVLVVILIVGCIIASVASGENKIKQLAKHFAEKKREIEEGEAEKKGNRNETTIIKKKTNKQKGVQADWKILVRDKTNQYTIKKTFLSLADFTEEPFRIGRGADCDLKLNNSYVSEEHALIIYDDERESIVYIDNGSSNGTYLNSYYDGNDYVEGEKIETIAVENGLTLYLWDTPIVFVKMHCDDTNESATNLPSKKTEKETRVYHKR